MRMADVVIVGCLFTFLLINACHGGLPGLEDLAEDTTHSSGIDVQLVNHPVSINMMMVHQPRYKCQQCELPDCSEGSSFCEEALSCYKSSVRDAAGELQHSRGCDSAHAQFSCRYRPTRGDRKRHGGQRNVTCCMGDLCNGGDFPTLAPHDAAVTPLPAQA